MLKKIKNKIIYIIQKYSNLIILFLQNKLNVTHNYQPNPFSKSQNDKNDTISRYKNILSNISHDMPKSVLDLGCNRGFFPLKMSSDNDCFSVGVDHDWFELLYAKALAEKYKIGNAVFINKEINIEFLDTLPVFDMTVCTSIFHHWVKNYGKEDAFKMMQIIADSTSKYLVFETGQFDEKETRWYKKLDFMGDDCENWISDFLLSLGFKTVIPTGEYKKNLSSGMRTMFIAIK